jgi:hypothetical protein
MNTAATYAQPYYQMEALDEKACQGQSFLLISQSIQN